MAWWNKRATEATAQRVLMETLRTRQILQQIAGIQESLLAIQMQNNVLLRQLARYAKSSGEKTDSGELPIIRPPSHL